MHIHRSIVSSIVVALALSVPFTLHAQGAAACSVEVGFSPEGSASNLVSGLIDSARSSIRLAAYGFTSPNLIKRLIDAKRRGVDVRIIVDSGGNQTAASKAALNLVVNAGIPTRTINVYPIHHDKYMVIDESSIQTGSMNYTKGGETRNSENTLAVRACPRLARLYLDHWANRWDKGVDARSSY